MTTLTDQQLLHDFAERRSDAAFSELVRRHVNLVYSAALRMVRDAHLAEDVTQGVFVALSNKAGQLLDRPVLSGWLHRTAQNLAANAIRSDVRRRAREQEVVVMNELLAPEPDAVWEDIAPHLDTALGELSEPDRDALMLRYFEHKSAREMAQTLGTSEEAAQKRVNRAVERLRELFTKRNVTVGASGLVILISTNGVQAAPVGLFAVISSAISLGGTAIQVSTVAAATKTIAMTTLQKTLITTALAIATGTGIYEARRASTLQNTIESHQQKQLPLVEEIRKLKSERENLARQVAALAVENERLHRTVAEVPKLRGDLVRSRTAQQQQLQSKTDGMDPNDPAVRAFLDAKAQAEQIANHLERMPDKTIPELKLLTDLDWLAVTKEAKFETDADIRKTLQKLRSLAKQRMFMGSALASFAEANDGQLPADISQLKPWFKKSLNDHNATADDATLDAIFERYKLLHTGNLRDFSEDTWFIVEKAPVDKDYDSRAKFGNGRSTVMATGIGETGDPDDKSY